MTASDRTDPPPGSTEPFRVAAMTMVHREGDYLARWVAHYGAAVGRENCYVLLHGGDAEMAALASGCRLIYLPRLSVRASFDRDRIALISAYGTYLLTQYNALISGDVDELVFVDPALGLSLGAFIAAHAGPGVALKAFNLNIVQGAGEYALDAARPVLAQRRHARTDPEFSKPLVVYGPPRWSGGFHEIEGAASLPDGLFVAHLHHACKRIARGIDTQRRESFGAHRGLGAARDFHVRWWTQRRAHTRKYITDANAMPEVGLDHVIADWRSEMRATLRPSRWFPGQGVMSFPERKRLRLRLPARFAGVV